jgi:hypothetical protein
VAQRATRRLGERSVTVELTGTGRRCLAACFEERWQTILTFGDRCTGAFFLHDSSAARWFHAPFYEVADSNVGSRTPAPTCVGWPAYLTTASVVPQAEAPQEVRVPPGKVVPAPPTAPARRDSAAFTRWIVTVRRTPANAIAGVGRAAVTARRSAFDLLITLGARALAVSHHIREGIRRIRSERASRAAQRKAEADAARAREEERRAKEGAERRPAREEAQRRAAEAEKRRAAEQERRRQAAELEERRQAEEAEARRSAEAEAQRKAAEEEQRRAAETEAQRQGAEAKRKVREAEEEARRKAREVEEEARRRAADAEALRISLVVAATRQQLARPPVEGSRREVSRVASAQATDHEDTTAFDTPGRYLALATREGFDASAKIERGSPEEPETFWLLYERESRARCRRLRATGALERDWKVSPG